MADNSQNGQSASGGGGNILLGFGSPRPVSRVKTYGMFGHVPDAFDGKSIKIGEDHEKRLKAQREKEQGKAEVGKKTEEEGEKTEEKENGEEQKEEEEPEADVVDACPLPVSEGVSL